MKRTCIQLVAPLLLITSLTSAQDAYGAGTPGAGNVFPTLSCGEAWMGNTGFALNIDSALGGATAWLGVSFARVNTSYGGASVLVDVGPSNVFILTPIALPGPIGVPGAGSAVYPYALTMPPTPSLAGLHVYAQVVIDEGGIYASSRGLDIELVMPPRLLFDGARRVVDTTAATPGLVASLATGNDSEFAHGRRRAYVATSLGVAEVNFDVAPPTSSSLFAAPGIVYGIGVDHVNNRTYTLSGNAVGQRELIGIDTDLTSPGYGTLMASTIGLMGAGGWVERWELAPDGRAAAVLTVFSRQLIIVDTDPTSPNYMGWTNVGFVPVDAAIFPIATHCNFTPDGTQVLVTVQTGGSAPGEVARYHRLLGQWLDHNPLQPGVQNIGSQSAPPATVPAAPWTVSVARSGTFAVVSGWASGGGLGRIDLDTANPFYWSYTPVISPVILGGASWACDISGDDTQFVTVGSGQALVFDVATGAFVTGFAVPGVGSPGAICWY